MDAMFGLGRGATARDVMSAPAIACSEDATFEEIARLLADREISGMPVIDRHGTVVGVLSERDVARAWGSPLARLSLAHGTTTGPFLRKLRGVGGSGTRARHVMRTPAITAHPDTPVRTVASIMVKEGVNRLPVVRAGHLVGVVTRGDVLAYVAGSDHHLPELEEPPIVVGLDLNDPQDVLLLTKEA